MSSFNAAAESLDSTPPPAATRRLRNSKATNGLDTTAVAVMDPSAANKDADTKDNNSNISLNNLPGFGSSNCNSRQQGVLTPSPENHITDHEMPDLSESQHQLQRNSAAAATAAATLEAETTNNSNNKNCSNSDDEDMVSQI